MNKYINSTYIDKKLLRRIYIYFIFSIIMFIVSLYELYATNYKLIYAIIIELIWIWIWLLITRMFHISWNKEQKQVISKIDVLWWIILTLYIIFSIIRHYIFNLYLPNNLILPVTFSLISWIMVWRFIWMKYKVIKILKYNLINIK